MLHLSALLVLISIGSAVTAPILLDNDFYNSSKTLVIYTSQHDIVNIFVPPISRTALEFNIFFVEADQDNEHTTYQGLYVTKFTHDHKNFTKLLHKSGKDITCDEDNIYIGARDGIYKFNENEVNAEKYGNVTENIKNIAKVNGSDLFYVLTEDNQLYRVTENGTKMTLDDNVVDAQQIVLDLAQNLYYYSSDKELWVLSDGVKRKFEGLPKQPSYLRMLKPPTIFQQGIPIVINNEVYGIIPNGSIQNMNFNVLVKPSAYSVEAGLLHFYSHNKRIVLYMFIVDLIELIVKALNV